MKVENYTRNLLDWKPLANRGQGACGLVKQPATISKRAYARIIREAKSALDGFGIDFDQFEEPVVVFFEMHTASVEWKHKTSGNLITASEIWFEHKTGEVLQIGSNHGDLTY